MCACPRPSASRVCTGCWLGVAPTLRAGPPPPPAHHLCHSLSGDAASPRLQTADSPGAHRAGHDFSPPHVALGPQGWEDLQVPGSLPLSPLPWVRSSPHSFLAPRTSNTFPLKTLLPWRPLEKIDGECLRLWSINDLWDTHYPTLTSEACYCLEESSLWRHSKCKVFPVFRTLTTPDFGQTFYQLITRKPQRGLAT